MKYIYVCDKCGCTFFSEDEEGMWCEDCGKFFSYYDAWDIMENFAEAMEEELKPTIMEKYDEQENG